MGTEVSVLTTLLPSLEKLKLFEGTRHQLWDSGPCYREYSLCPGKEGTGRREIQRLSATVVGRNGVTAGMTVGEPAGKSRQAAGNGVRQAEIGNENLDWNLTAFTWCKL